MPRAVHTLRRVIRGAQGAFRNTGPGHRIGSRRSMETSRITATLPAQDVARARAFYVEKVGLPVSESPSLEASDGRVGLIVGDGVNKLFVYPARTRSSAEFTQAVIQV